MRIFDLSLEFDAFEWFTNLADNRIKTCVQFETTFNSIWGDNKKNRHLLDALTNTKKIKNETIEEFNKKFTDFFVRL